MKSLRLIFVASLIVVALIGIALFTILKALPESDFIRDSVCNGISTVTKHNATLGAVKISVSFPSLIELRLENLTVKSSQGEELFSAESISLVPALASLLHQEVAIESITLIGLRLQVKREPDGTVLSGFLPVPAQRQSLDAPMLNEKQQAEGSSSDTAAPQKSTQRYPLQWSVNSVRIVNGQIDWTDSAVIPGQQTKISVKEFMGTIDRQGKGLSSEFKLNGKLAGDHGESGILTMEGVVQHPPDMASIDQVEAQLRAEAVRLTTVGPYLGGLRMLAKDFKIHALESRLTWGKDKPAKIALATEIIGDAEGKSQIKFKGEFVAENDFSTIKVNQATCQIAALPVRTLKSLLPKNLPFNMEKGFIGGQASGTWTGPKNWNCQGQFHVEDAELSDKYAGFAKKIRMQTQAKLNHDSLVVDNFEISESSKLASVKGSVSEPLSRSPRLDLIGEVVVKSSWIRECGVQVPEGLTLTGLLPLNGTIKGSIEDPVVNVTLDLGKLGISWSPYFEKLPTTTGAASLKGRLPLNSQLRHKDGAFPQLEVRADLPEINVRMSPQDKSLIGSHLQLESKVGQDSKGYNLKDIVFIVNKGNRRGEFLSARGNILELGSETTRIDMTGAINWDNFLEAPLKATGRLNQISSWEKLTGKLSVELGRGKLKGGFLTSILPQEQLAVQNLIKAGLQLSGDTLDFDTIAGSFQFGSGLVRTDDLRLKGPLVGLGVIGTLRLNSQNLEALTCVQSIVPGQAVATAGKVLAKIPEVQKLVKQNEGLIKAMGLDKELKRFGIQPTVSDQEKGDQPDASNTPATIIVRLRGPITGLEKRIVWESELDKGTVSRLKALVN